MSVNRLRFEESCGLCGSRPSCGSVHAPQGPATSEESASKSENQEAMKRVPGERLVGVVVLEPGPLGVP